MLKAVIAAVREVAEEQILPRYPNVARRCKTDGSLVTAADLASQEALVRRLQAIHPVPVIGEEMSEAQQLEFWQAGEQGLWCIDPIDGTTNFANGLPYFAVSVALMERGQSVLGIVYNPVSREMFYAEKGGGAYLDGERLPCREGASRLKSAVAAVDLKRLEKPLATRLTQSPPYSSQRNFGACSLEWCYTAAGRFDAYLHGGQQLWDYAAGSLILTEAGGNLCCVIEDDFSQGPIWKRSAIAALNPQLFEQWKNWIRE